MAQDNDPPMPVPALAADAPPAVTEADLPSWMRPRRRQIDWGLIFVLALALLVVHPLLARNGIPRDTDLALAELRSIEVARLARAGILFSRWMPDAHYTFGSPLFNYLAPLPHYLPGYHQAITDVSPADSIRLFMILSVLGAGIGMYRFARQRWGTLAGVLAALAYLYSTPLVLTLPYVAGDLGLMMALGALPFAAWSLDALWLAPAKRSFFATLICLTAFALTDARLVGFGALALLVVAWTGRWLPGAAKRYTGAYMATAVAGAICLTAFFWLPAVAELRDVYYLAAAESRLGGALSLQTLFAPPAAHPANLLNPTLQPGIGLGVCLLAGLGALGAVSARRYDGLPLLGLGVALIVVTTPLFGRFWGDPSGFQTLQPYHAVLIATFCLATMAGQAVRLAGRLPIRGQAAALIGLFGVPLISAAPALVPPPWSARREPYDVLYFNRLELQGDHTGALRDGILLPSTAATLPSPQPNLLESLAAGTLNRLRLSGLPADSRLGALPLEPLRLSLVLNTQESAALEFLILYAPGWRATIGDRPAELYPSPNGLLTLSVPPVNGALQLNYGETPARDAAWLITFAGWGVLFITSRQRWLGTLTEEMPVEAALPPTVFVALVALLALYTGLTFAVRYGVPPTSRGNVIAEPMTALPRFLQDGVDLRGYHLAGTQFRPGDILDAQIFWQAARPLTETEQSELWLTQPGSPEPILRVAHRHPGGLSTLRWTLGGYVRDDFRLHLPQSLPPGDYVLQVAIGPCASQDRLPCPKIQGMDAFNAVGQVERGAVTIPVVIRVR